MITEHKREHGSGLPMLRVMACSNQKLFRRVTSNPYTPPAGATPEGYCKVFDKGRPSRRNKNQTKGEGKGLRNAEFLIALILENEGHATAIPPDWWIVKGKSPAKRKSPEISPSPEVSPGPEVHPLDEDIDLDDPERYATHCTGSLQVVCR